MVIVGCESDFRDRVIMKPKPAHAPDLADAQEHHQEGRYSG